jgi:uncharacterized membrane protein
MNPVILAWILGILFLLSVLSLLNLNRPKTAAEHREYALSNKETLEDRLFTIAATIAILSGAGFVGTLIALANLS